MPSSSVASVASSPPLLAACLALLPPAMPAQDPATRPDLPFPGSLEKAAREAGNPLATYAAMLERDAAYRASKLFAAVYPEVRCNFEQFLGVPLAGVEAMSLPAFRAAQDRGVTPIDAVYEPRDAVDVVVQAARRTRVVIWGEEHHLPQTRCLYERLLRELWPLGYRYLAAETFTEDVMAPGFRQPDYRSGWYLMDPVFATAVRTATSLGYRLIAYDTTERGPAGDAGFRDRAQAQNIENRALRAEPEARVLVLAGRGHAAEVPPADGWRPMAAVLRERTGIDPFTVYAPTMSERSTPAEEDPRYRFATERGLVRAPTIFVRRGTLDCLGSGHCDALVFWPRIELASGRPDWLTKCMDRKLVAIPSALREGAGLRLVQAFREGDPDTVVPVDQVLLRDGEPVPALALPAGRFRVRAVDARGPIGEPARLDV
jgi:hypothetical protein